ncbi:hypothetical protein KUV85_17275 [Nocardioides panacisoli]|uniref:vWA domain-containing protein n=1 Tax=Nocardioides panacisoli TaxID=627624 RepID=UPI001C6274EB|nr:hypothetical protein [Nocardioides panacisoli]QYJ04051.1 hypothetical protein KUV85_17275 [Nocardioides panacisoli]
MEVTWIGGELGLRWPWLVVALSLLVVALLVLWLRPWRRRAATDPAWVAHAERLRSLPRFRDLVRQRATFGALASVAVLIAIAGTIILGGRVEQQRALDEDVNARDVILCLDASGSMAEYNVEVLQEMQRVVSGLDGERVGLAIWSKATITIFPLTDDYDYAQERLAEAEEAFQGIQGLFTDDADLDRYFEYVAGTQRLDGGADIVSQIGDGLASCVQRFGDLESERGRAIILASDNEPYGQGVFTLEEASQYAVQNQVVVHGIGTEGFEKRAADLTDFEAAVTRTGGLFGHIDDESSAANMVAQINELEAARVDEPPVVQTFDRPLLGIIVTSVGMVLLVGVWVAQWRAGRAARGRP